MASSLKYNLFSIANMETVDAYGVAFIGII